MPHRVVDAATATVALGERNLDEAVLSVVHVHGALGHAVRHDRAAADDAIAVDQLDPVVVLDPDLSRVLRTDPDLLTSAGERLHEPVVLVLRVNGPLEVGGQVAHRDP